MEYFLESSPQLRVCYLQKIIVRAESHYVKFEE